MAILNVCWDAGFCILSARLSSGFAKATYVFKVQYSWSAGFGGGGWSGKGVAEFSTLAKGGPDPVLLWDCKEGFSWMCRTGVEGLAKKGGHPVFLLRGKFYLKQPRAMGEEDVGFACGCLD